MHTKEPGIRLCLCTSVLNQACPARWLLINNCLGLKFLYLALLTGKRATAVVGSFACPVLSSPVLSSPHQSMSSIHPCHPCPLEATSLSAFCPAAWLWLLISTSYCSHSLTSTAHLRFAHPVSCRLVPTISLSFLHRNSPTSPSSHPSYRILAF